MMQFATSMFDTVASSSTLLILSILLEIVSVVVINLLCIPLKAFSDERPPDLWFGFSPASLNSIYAAWGPGGRAAYFYVGLWDFFPYMPAYTLLLGTLLTMAAKRTKGRVHHNVSYVIIFVFVCDWIESAILMLSCRKFPEQLAGAIISIGSAANMLKWIGFVFTLTLIPFVWIVVAPKGVKTQKLS
jgi:hypothetical protein